MGEDWRGERGCVGGGSCKQSDGHRGLSTRQGKEGRVEPDEDGEPLLSVRGH